jgi:hypothetical protein
MTTFHVPPSEEVEQEHDRRFPWLRDLRELVDELEDARDLREWDDDDESALL